MCVYLIKGIVMDYTHTQSHDSLVGLFKGMTGLACSNVHDQLCI